MSRRELWSGLGRGVATATMVGLLAAVPAAAQIPDEFQNLKVLPKDIGKRQLINVMRGFAMGLGVRCQHCHVGEEGKPLSEFDFASDQKETKKIARVMLRMTKEINDKFLPEVHRPPEAVEVRCVTCHRGQDRPRMLEQVLLKKLNADGVEAAIARYRELRERYYGGFTFDFSERTLNNLAQQLAEREKTAEAITFLELNTELYPDGAMSYFFLGELFGAGGEKAKAIANYKKSLELNPENRAARQKLEQLSQE